MSSHLQVGDLVEHPTHGTGRIQSRSTVTGVTFVKYRRTDRVLPTLTKDLTKAQKQ